MTKRIVYYPPSRQTIEQYARKVCEKLAEQDITFLQPEVIDGFTNFLVLATKIQAKYLTKRSETENKLDSTAD